MNLRQYLITMVISTILCWAAWIFVIMNVDPFSAGVLGFSLFYTSLALALIGTISLLAFGLFRLFGSHDTPLFRHVRMSFRTACIMSLLAITGLYLLSLEIFTFFNALIFILICAVIISLDFSLTTTKKSPAKHLHSFH